MKRRKGNTNCYSHSNERKQTHANDPHGSHCFTAPSEHATPFLDALFFFPTPSVQSLQELGSGERSK